MTQPKGVLPQIELTGSKVALDPEAVLAHAVRGYHRDVRKEATLRIAAAGLDFTGDTLAKILLEVAGGSLNPFRITAGVAFRLLAQRTRDRDHRPATQVDLALEADEAAQKLGSYLASQDAQATMEGFNVLMNAKVPPKEAARRAVEGFGLTPAQQRSAFKMKDDPVSSAKPGAYRSKIKAYIERALHMRTKNVVREAVRQVELDTLQATWEEGLRDGTIPATARKVWYTAADERTCPVCAPMDKVDVAVTDRFHLPDGNRVKMPPVHPNCRCSVGLVAHEDQIMKAAPRWKESEHPRTSDGRFGTKVRVRSGPEVTPGPAVANQVFLGDSILGEAVRMQGKPIVDSGPQIAAGPQVTSGPVVSSGPVISSGPVVGSPAAAAPPEIKSVTIAGRPTSLRSLDLSRQAQIATVIAGNAAHQQRQLPDGVEPMGDRKIAFASNLDMNVQQYESSAWDGNQSGYAQIESPLRFVDGTDREAVRREVDRAMESLDDHLRSQETEWELSEMRDSTDPLLSEAGRDMAVQVGASDRRVKGKLYVSARPEDVQDAWRYTLAPINSGYQGYYDLDCFDETGTAISSLRVSAACVVSMSDVHPEWVPRVVVAPYGTWNSDSRYGTTADRMDERGVTEVTGLFSWTTQNDVIILEPDAVHDRLGRDMG